MGESFFRRVYLSLVRAPFGRGNPRAVATWDEEFKSGGWGYLDSVDELAHYAVIAGFLKQLFPAPRIYDVGCGHGRLFDLLGGVPFASYLGADMSAEAVRQASRHQRTNVAFATRTFEDPPPAGPFDAIVFNESLYYAERPAEIVDRHLPSLADGGRFVVSICAKGRHRHIWRNLAREYVTVHAVRVENEKGQAWNVRVLARG